MRAEDWKQADGSAGFEMLVEHLRLKSFRVYECVRAAQRERDSGMNVRLAHLMGAAATAREIAEEVALLNFAAQLSSDDELLPVAPI
jgi:hypothetical protein